jgi:hypothetical protein
MPARTSNSMITMTEFVANQKIAFEGDAVGPLKPRGSFVFDPAPSGIKVTALPTPEPRGTFELMMPMMAGYIEKQNQTQLDNLKRLLEC